MGNRTQESETLSGAEPLKTCVWDGVWATFDVSWVAFVSSFAVPYW